MDIKKDEVLLFSLQRDWDNLEDSPKFRPYNKSIITAKETEEATELLEKLEAEE